MKNTIIFILSSVVFFITCLTGRLVEFTSHCIDPMSRTYLHIGTLDCSVETFILLCNLLLGLSFIVMSSCAVRLIRDRK